MRCVFLLSAAAFAAAATSQTIVVPNFPASYAATEAPSSTAYPWGRGTSQIRVQQIYDSTHFTSQGITYPILVNNLRWRANGAVVTAGYTYNAVGVQMSTAAVDYLAPSTTFASNHGGDLASVFSGPVAVASGAGTTPNNWYVNIPITPFLYDPTTGNDLCVDMSHDGTGPTVTTGPAVDCAFVAADLTSRIYNLTNYLAATGTIQQNVSLVMEVAYTPASGLYASFVANVTGGATPLAVNFTDQTFTSDPGGITSWAWDLDGDSVIDSNVQNPSFVYNTCGSYNVSLTVTDATHPPNTFTRNAYIVTDNVTPGFTSALIASSTVQFTDTSTPVPTSWAWDLDGDNIVDSTVQNPVWVYSGNCALTTVTLTTNRLCRGPFTVSRAVAASNFLETRRDGGTSIAAGGGNYINVSVTNPTGLNICRMEMKTTAAANAAVTFNVFVTPGTYVGAENNLALWRQIGSASTTGAVGAADLEMVQFNPTLYLPAGNYGMHLQVAVGGGPQYSTQTAATTYSNADLSITTGSSGVLGGAPIANRVWNGAFYYTDGAGQVAGYGFFEAGCAGSMGVSRLTPSGPPALGSAMTVTVNNLPLSAAILMIGFSRTSSVFGPLPLDATPFGAPGCFGRVSPDATSFLFGGGNTANWLFGIPVDTGLIGLQLFNQGLVPDPGFNALGAVFSDAAAMIIGM